MKKIFKNKEGISLIALVITIIVLVILAMITVAVLTGENGLLSRTAASGDNYELEAFREQVLLHVEDIVEDLMLHRVTPTLNLIAERLRDDYGYDSMKFRMKPIAALEIPTAKIYEIIVVEDWKAAFIDPEFNVTARRWDISIAEDLGPALDFSIATSNKTLLEGAPSHKNPIIPKGFRPVNTPDAEWVKKR